MVSAWALSGRKQQRGGEGLEQGSKEAQLLRYPRNREKGPPTPNPEALAQIMWLLPVPEVVARTGHLLVLRYQEQAL